MGNKDVEAIRDAKGRLAQHVKGYLPKLHQLELTRSLDVLAVWSLSDSFDKLVRTLGSICGVEPGTRPLDLKM
jgi:hypothetical protein